jgi:hypothetical protein
VLFSAAKATGESFEGREVGEGFLTGERPTRARGVYIFLIKEQREMSSGRDEKDDSTEGGEGMHEGTHGGLAIGRTTGMGAGIAKGGTPGVGESGDEGATVDASGEGSTGSGDKGEG